MGDDLIYRDGNVQTDYVKRASTERSIFGINKMMKENPVKAGKLVDEIIRNTYRTLMTRGQKGCFVYCTDKALAEYLNDRISRVYKYEGDEFFREEMHVAEKENDYDAE